MHAPHCRTAIAFIWTAEHSTSCTQQSPIHISDTVSTKVTGTCTEISRLSSLNPKIRKSTQPMSRAFYVIICFLVINGNSDQTASAFKHWCYILSAVCDDGTRTGRPFRINWHLHSSLRHQLYQKGLQHTVCPHDPNLEVQHVRTHVGHKSQLT